MGGTPARRIMLRTPKGKVSYDLSYGRFDLAAAARLACCTACTTGPWPTRTFGASASDGCPGCCPSASWKRGDAVVRAAANVDPSFSYLDCCRPKATASGAGLATGVSVSGAGAAGDAAGANVGGGVGEAAGEPAGANVGGAGEAAGEPAGA